MLVSFSCLCAAGLVLVCVAFFRPRKWRLRGTGVVLTASMLSLQAVFLPSAEQAIAQQMNDQEADEDTADPIDPIPLKTQIDRHGKRIRAGHAEGDLSLRLPAPASVAPEPSPCFHTPEPLP